LSGAGSILIVSQYYAPDVTAAAFRITETAGMLARRGYRVAVVTARPHRGKSREGGAGAEDSAVSGVTVIRVPLLSSRGKGKWNYILHYSSFLLTALVAGIFCCERPSVVWATSPPLFAGLVGLIIATFKGARFVLDVRDLWPDSLVSAGQFRRDTMAYRLLAWLERFLYQKARAITCVSKPMAGVVALVAGAPKVEVIYNGVPEELCMAQEKSEVHPGGSLELVYVGNFGPLQCMELFLEGLKAFQEAGGKGIRFRFVGDGVERASMESFILERGLRDVSVEGPYGKEEAMKVMGGCSALVLALRDDGTLEKTIPSKVFDYMAAGKPVLYGIKGEGAEILALTGGNIPFDSSSPGSFAGALRVLQANPGDYGRHAEGNRTIIRERFTRERMVDLLEEKLVELGARPVSGTRT